MISLWAWDPDLIQIQFIFMLRIDSINSFRGGALQYFLLVLSFKFIPPVFEQSLFLLFLWKRGDLIFFSFFSDQLPGHPFPNKKWNRNSKVESLTSNAD